MHVEQWLINRPKPYPKTVDERVSRDSIAYHEAGHAVVSSFLGRTIRHVTIATSTKDGGHVRLRLPIWMKPFYYSDRSTRKLSRKHQAELAQQVAISYAGQYAQMKFDPQAASQPSGWDNDDSQADHLIFCLCRGGLSKGAVALYKRCLRAESRHRTVARRLIDELWPGIQAVAEALLAQERLTGAKVATILLAVGRRNPSNTEGIGRTARKNASFAGGAE